jgi:predicted nucleic acid-binding protein
MNPVGPVVDAGLAMKSVVLENFKNEARHLLQDNAGGNLFAPPLLPNEVTNTLFQRQRRGSITASEADAALTQFLRFGVTLVQPPQLYQQAFAFARSSALQATYGSVYVVLAQLLGTELWTADGRLLAALSGKAPWVRWIGTYT